ncbi:hypothetical protein [Pseudoalteromonas luteoviolacea]|uniref:Uncharacterized protein n=1 Tax=Pseudoalteromonas luteoviolacea S4054 TaxID=1129367 RepID=A0A0F6A9F0_9GAMM|nr:hypothetical protein [Pseudoalteromonas luteoviolacea]AOT06892.1 hypothetical protein S4054249_02925 [Pseudoalteromonas luteoviolacea]AOT11810.1 hypothetical protein S40542_02925 [Pseudoalteromonas luteoviolacea]AOT16722.1 hypothetical protein S4054_02925 [Pseudoalteromonas luteoviolacea]KKE82783.1 hypothetical protein N479_17150 [Pseudoalteromonas luteoviolacea S4054]KZN72994.1 hypothetical protein N481_14155 [Pseudoalteromonas luteoviolacea S4047-1]
MSDANRILGGFGPIVLAQDFDKEYINAFEHINKRDGVEIKPLAAQSQVVNGKNFAFYCFVSPVVAPNVPKVNRLELIVVNQQGEHFTQLSDRTFSEPVLVPPIGSFDSVALRENFTEAEKNAAEQIESLVGVSYKILAAQQQVVAGLNFAFYSVVIPVTPNAQAFFARIDAHRNFEGKLVDTQLHHINP